MADPSLVSTSTSSGLSRSQDDLFFNYFLSGEQSMEDDSGPSLPMPLGSGAHATENFLLESLGSPQSEEELLVNSSPYGHSEVSSPSFDTISYEDRLVFQQLWSELAPYGSQAEDPQAFAQSLMMPPPSEESYVSESSPEAEEQGENPKKRKRIRKRTKKEEGPFEPTAVSLPREKLLVLSSKEMQQYVDELRRTRTLTPEEERDIKRQKRLIKNRESALASRTRKKAHVEVLQQQINDINKEKEAMREGLDSLAAENESLKQQVQHLQNVIRKTSFLSELWEKMTAASKRQVRPDQATSSVATATACLFVILFTFGLFFDPVKTNRQLGDKQTSLAETLAGSSFLDEASNTLSSPLSSASASSNSLSSSSDGTSSFRTHRKLLGFDEFEDPLATATTTTTTTTTTSSSSSSTSSSSSSAASTSSTSADLTDDAVRKPLNASSYVLCSSPHHVTVDEEGASTLPSLVTFFLPADLVRQTVLTMATQLSCQFLDAATMAHITAAATAAAAANNAANPSINTTE